MTKDQIEEIRKWLHVIGEDDGEMDELCDLALKALQPEERRVEFDTVGCWDGTQVQWYPEYKPAMGDYLFRPKSEPQSRSEG